MVKEFMSAAEGDLKYFEASAGNAWRMCGECVWGPEASRRSRSAECETRTRSSHLSSTYKPPTSLPLPPTPTLCPCPCCAPQVPIHGPPFPSSTPAPCPQVLIDMNQDKRFTLEEFLEVANNLSPPAHPCPVFSSPALPLRS